MILAWVYVVIGVLLHPLVVVLVYLHPRLRAQARERLGWVVPEVEPGALWMHAASLGEGRIVEALAPSLPLPVVRTCTSNVARPQDTGAAWTSCLPVDTWPAVTAWIDLVRPRALVLVEAEVWPTLLLACRSRRIPVWLLSPREGPGMARLARVPGLTEYLFLSVTVVRPEQDLKRVPPRRAPAFSWEGEALVAACTHEGEEQALLDAWWFLPSRPLLVIAPRDARRFEAVAGMLAESASARGFRLARRTQFGPDVPPGAEVVLLDTIGELSSLYRRVRAAFVGGTLVEGDNAHAPGEILAGGATVLRGPNVTGNHEAWDGVDCVVAGSSRLSGALAEALARPRGQPSPPPGVAAVVDALAGAFSAPVPVERPTRPWLWPLVPFWMLGVALRRKPLRRAALPVVSVGALSAQGPGKTPVAAWIASRLAGSVVVSRGHGRRGGADARTAGEATDLGDELAMLARRGQAVVSCPDRLAAIEVAAKAGAKVAVLDDGLQYRAVARDLEVVVIDARWPDSGGPIPVGSRRVPRSWLRLADVVWCNHGTVPSWVRDTCREGTIFVEAVYRPVAWRYRGERLSLGAIPPRPAVALAGIARPEGFFRQLAALGLRVERTMVFADHHPFSWHDLQAIEAWKDDHVVVTTEKDAARLPVDAGVWVLLVEPLLVSGEEALIERLARIEGGLV